MEKSPELLIVGVVLAIAIFFLRKQLSRKRTFAPGDLTVADNDDLISYICEQASKKKVPKRDDTARAFILENFESLKFSFVYHSKQMLFMNDVPALIEKAVQQYVK